MNTTEPAGLLRLYDAAEVAAQLGRHVSVSWVRARAREDHTLVCRHTGRRKMLFTEQQVARLRSLITGPPTVAADVIATVSSSVATPSSTDLDCQGDPGSTRVAPEAVSRRTLRSLNPAR